MHKSSGSLFYFADLPLAPWFRDFAKFFRHPGSLGNAFGKNLPTSNLFIQPQKTYESSPNKTKPTNKANDLENLSIPNRQTKQLELLSFK